MNIFSKILSDKIVFSPESIKESFRPIGKRLKKETKILATFNPGAVKLANGNILLMVRVAEAIVNPIKGNKIGSIRWDEKKGYVIDYYKKKDTNLEDPRAIKINNSSFQFIFPLLFYKFFFQIIMKISKIISKALNISNTSVHSLRRGLGELWQTI